MISIVVNYLHPEDPNRYQIDLYEMTVGVIANIRESTVSDHEVILVHHGGQVDPDMADMVDVYINNAERLSCAESYNLGFNSASGDVFINMHNDVELPHRWDVPLVSAAQDGLVGCVIADEFDSDCELRGVGKSDNLYIPSCCFSISRENWERLGGYDETFRPYHFEDTDLFLRAAKENIHPVRCDVTVKHHRGITRSFTQDDERPFVKKNEKYYVEKHKDIFEERGNPFWLTLPLEPNYVP